MKASRNTGKDVLRGRPAPRTTGAASDPPRTLADAKAMAGTRRYVNPTIDRTPRARAASAAATIASASATVLASGFSHRTCLPASNAAIAISACACSAFATPTSVATTAGSARR